MAKARASTAAGATLDRESAIPLWSQLYGDLRRRLDLGAFPTTFPSELALVEEYGVSRNTVREALRRLRHEGLVIASRGRRPRPAHTVEIEQPLGALYSLFASIQERGLRQRSVVRALELCQEASVASRLGLTISAPLVFLERLRVAGDEPLAVDRVWLPAEQAAPLLEVDFREVGFYNELAERTGIRLTGGSEHIRAVIPDRSERALLQMPSGVAAFEIDRLGWAGETPIEWRNTLLRADRFGVTAAFSAVNGYHVDTAAVP